jgi:hypothetical protein
VSAQAAAATPGAAEAPVRGKGPASVILVSRELPRTGRSTVHIAGEVRNVGGADAQRVGVTISSVDSTAGTPCLSEEARVTPSTLHSGESGKFDVDVDSPCLLGNPQIDVAPVWDWADSWYAFSCHRSEISAHGWVRLMDLLAPRWRTLAMLDSVVQIRGPIPVEYEIHEVPGVPLHAHLNARHLTYSNISGTLIPYRAWPPTPIGLAKRRADRGRDAKGQTKWG